MSHALTMNNFTAPPFLCNQTLIAIPKDEGWHQKMKVMQSTLQTLKHFQGEVWYKEGCKDKCGSRRKYSCQKLFIPPKLSEALEEYERFCFFKNENKEDDSLAWALPWFDCWTSYEMPFSSSSNSWITARFAKNDLGKVNTPAEIKKRAGLERWIKRAITDMELVIQNYEEGLGMPYLSLPFLPTPSPRTARPPPWKVWPIMFLLGGPVALVMGGFYYFANHWPNKQTTAVNDSTERASIIRNV